MGEPSFLRKTLRVGGYGLKVNYSREEAAFQAADVPEHKREIRRKVLASTQPKILLNHKRWYGGTQTGEPICLRRFRQLSKYDHALYKYNYRSEALPPHKAEFLPRTNHLEFDRTALIPDAVVTRNAMTAATDLTLRSRRTMEMPIHPNLETMPKWNGSTEASLRHSDSFRRLEKLRKRNSARAGREIEGKRTSLIKREAKFMDTVRQTKAATGTWDVNATPETLKARAQLDRERRSSSPTWLHQRKPLPNRSRRVYYHDGAWGKRRRRCAGLVVLWHIRKMRADANIAR